MQKTSCLKKSFTQNNAFIVKHINTFIPMKRYKFFILISLLHMQFAACNRQGITVSELQCEYMTNPLGIDTETPRFSWKIHDLEYIRGQGQTAYRIVVASSLKNLKNEKPDIWDSGKISSEQLHLVPYGGNKLQPGGDYYWKVMIYDRDGKPSEWSKPARFSMGLLNRSDWKGDWIMHPSAKSNKHIWFRKELNLNDKAASAFIYVASLGFHELYVNGKKADDRVLAPAVSRIDKRVLYVTYDITSLLKKGKNAIALWYGPGWTRNNFFSSLTNQAVLLQLNGKTRSGETFTLHSDETWKSAESYSRNSGGFSFMDMGGEEVDGNKFTDKWNTLAFDDKDWQDVRIVNPLKKEGELILSAQMTDRSRVIGTIPAKSVTDTVPGVYRVDMGAHFTGFLEARFFGLQKGDTVRISVSERTYSSYKGKSMDASRSIGDNAIEEHRQAQYYIARGEDGETFHNRFNIFSGRYIHFIGLKKPPKVSDITGYAVSSAAERTGNFECSDSMFNRIYEIDRYTFEMCHVEGVIVDCPNRERLGYGPEGAYQTTWGLGLPCFASGAYYMKNVRDWEDVQFPDGSINNVAPQISRMYGCTLNGTANMNIAWEHYLMYGDKTILEKVRPVGEKWIGYLDTYVRDGMLTPYDTHGYFLGDWVSPGPVFEYGGTEEALFFNNCAYAMTLDFFIKISEELGYNNETTPYRERLEILRKNLHEKYFNPAFNSYLNGDQVRTSFALYAEIVPDSLRAAVLEHLKNDLKNDHPYINVGSFGRYPYYKVLLAEPCFYDIFAGILSKTSYPGYGYFFSQGLNAWPETWEIAHSNSAMMHTSYAGISAWFIKGLAGIEPDAADPSCRTITIRPHIVQSLSYAKAELESPYGTIKSGWRKENGKVIYDMLVPVGSKANIYLPARASAITESGQTLAIADGVSIKEETADYTIIGIESGKYSFEIE
jgi:alpha-L-rhamnosidase